MISNEYVHPPLQMKGSSRLQFVQFVSVLENLASLKGCGFDAVLYRVVSGGLPLPSLGPGESPPYYSDAERRLLVNEEVSRLA